MADEFQGLVGKTIAGVVMGVGHESPRKQIFLVFDDDTYYELYGDTLKGAGGLDKGGLAKAVKDAGWPGRRVTVFTAEGGSE
jgi:hypothetical protein